MESSLLLLIIIVIFGVLQIILFFKLWGMTNNVIRIKDDLSEMKLLLFKSADKKTRIKQVKEEGFNLLSGHFFSYKDDDKLKSKINSVVSSLENSINNIIDKYNCEDVYSINEFKEDVFKWVR